MRPAARVQGAIDLLDAIIAAARDGGASADTIAKEYFRTRRYIGSKDRRAVREYCYAVIRSLGDRPQSGRLAMIAYAMGGYEEGMEELFDGSQYGPAPITDDEKALASANIDDEPVQGDGHGPALAAIPNWLKSHLPEWLDAEEQAALFDRAPLDVRMNGLEPAELQAEFPDVIFDAELQNAARLPAGTQLAAHPFWREGRLDIQDMGSQHIVAACRPEENSQMIDLCAGAGGKALGLASLAAADAQILACDTSRARLSELPHRSHRLNIANIQSRLLDPGKEMQALADWAGRADMVLIDAPCSGTGTWRRSPETRWRLNPVRLQQLTQLQSHILQYAHELVRPGGILVYAVCSILPEEGPEQVSAFLEKQPKWSVDIEDIGCGRAVSGGRVHKIYSAHGIALSPLHDKTDGFFFTRLRKTC